MTTLLSLLCTVINYFSFYLSSFLIIAISFIPHLSCIILPSPLYEFSFLPVLFPHVCCRLLAISHCFFFYTTLHLSAFSLVICFPPELLRQMAYPFCWVGVLLCSGCGNTEHEGSGGMDGSELRYTSSIISKLLNVATKG